MDEKFCIATFYHFAKLENYEDMKPAILEFCKDNGIKGTILLAEEGINSTIAGEKANVLNFFKFLHNDSRLKKVSWQESESSFIPFQELKVRLKREIVRLADEDLELMDDANQSGEYINAEDWDKFIANDNPVLIDTRNQYETMLGKFKNAIEPNTENFRDFPGWFKSWVKINNPPKTKKIAMYCTGGVRCEKSTSYLKKLGYDNIYHLKGGILNYLQKTKNTSKNWHGSCFVFDDRVAVDDHLNRVRLFCQNCDALITTDDLKDVTKGRVICINCNNE